MSIEETKQQLKYNVVFTTIDPPILSGQSCGVAYSKLRLYSEELDLTIETGYMRSHFENKKLLLKLFDSALDDLIK